MTKLAFHLFEQLLSSPWEAREKFSNKQEIVFSKVRHGKNFLQAFTISIRLRLINYNEYEAISHIQSFPVLQNISEKVCCRPY